VWDRSLFQVGSESTLFRELGDALNDSGSKRAHRQFGCDGADGHMVVWHTGLFMLVYSVSPEWRERITVQYLGSLMWPFKQVRGAVHPLAPPSHASNRQARSHRQRAAAGAGGLAVRLSCGSTCRMTIRPT
jgi:hypothetical protein